MTRRRHIVQSDHRKLNRYPIKTTRKDSRVALALLLMMDGLRLPSQNNGPARDSKKSYRIIVSVTPINQRFSSEERWLLAPIKSTIVHNQTTHKKPRLYFSIPNKNTLKSKMKFAAFAFLLVSSVNGFNLYTKQGFSVDKKQLDQTKFLAFLEESAVDHIAQRANVEYQFRSSLDDLRHKSFKLSKELDELNLKSGMSPAKQRLAYLQWRAARATEYYNNGTPGLHP